MVGEDLLATLAVHLDVLDVSPAPVHLVVVRLPRPSDVGLLSRQWLGDEERTHLRWLGATDRRREWLAGRIAANVATACCCGIDLVRAALFDRGGCPAFGARNLLAERVGVSIAHSSDYVVAAAQLCGVLGVDLQRMRQRLPALGDRIATGCWNTFVAQVIDTMCDLTLIHAVWVTREAILKAMKRGITHLDLIQLASWDAEPSMSPLHSVGEPRMDPGRTALVQLEGGGVPWGVEIWTGATYCMAVAWQRTTIADRPSGSRNAGSGKEAIC